MLKDKYDSALVQMQSDKQETMRALYGSLLVNILLAVWIMTVDTSEKRTFIPPNVYEEFWVKGDEVSNEWMEMMGEHLASLVLSVTPKSVDYRKDIFLRYVHPESHGRLKNLFEIRAEEIKDDNLATMFYPIHYQFYKKQVAITGDFRSLMGSKEIENVRKTWLLEFSPDSSGVIQVVDMVEVLHANPFNLTNSSTTVN